MTSGAIQKGVPTNVFLFIWVSVSWPATPKSASFTSPCSDSNTLAAESNRDKNMRCIKYWKHSVLQWTLGIKKTDIASVIWLFSVPGSNRFSRIERLSWKKSDYWACKALIIFLKATRLILYYRNKKLHRGPVCSLHTNITCSCTMTINK